ncbi:hypothetical protein [Cupriavidus necator]
MATLKDSADPHRLNPKRYISSPYRSKHNVYFFESPKNNRRFGIYGIVAFCHLLLAEGDSNITLYRPSIPPTHETPDVYEQTAEIIYRDGRKETWYFSHEEKLKPAHRIIKTERQIRDSKWAPSNWLLLCSYQNRVRGLREISSIFAVDELIEAHSSFTVQNILDLPDVHRAYSLATVARYLAAGRLKADLFSEAFDRRTVLTRGAYETGSKESFAVATSQRLG